MEIKTKMGLLIVSLIVYIVALILTACWHEWKVFWLIFLFTFANNLTLAANYLIPKNDKS